jgi:hypothetical protein
MGKSENIRQIASKVLIDVELIALSRRVYWKFYFGGRFLKAYI